MFIWIAALASNIWVAVAGLFARKAVMATTSVAAGVALMLQLSVAINILLGQIMLSLPAWAAQGAFMFVPRSAGTCISIIITALGYRWAYNFAMRSIDRVIQS